MAVSAINEGRPAQSQLRATIREELKLRWTQYHDGLFVSTVCDEAVNQAFDTLKKCMKKWAKGEQAKLRFRSRHEARQGFVVQRCADGGQILPRYLGQTWFPESPGEVKGQTVRVIQERGRYFVIFHQTLVLSENQAGDKVAAVDPGVRTFATVFSTEEAIKYGDGFQDRIEQLQDQHDFYRSIRDKLPSLKNAAQWVRDRHRWVAKKLNKIGNRISDLVDDLHCRIAFDLVQKFDTILLPTFETSRMSRQGRRKIRKGTTRRMLTLAYYRFASVLAWMCRKYGKTLIRVNESYTSKTDSRTGEVKAIGGSKTINGLDRDINGARGILLRALTRGA